jgi:polyribonucleotide nucleotidyltransferase
MDAIKFMYGKEPILRRKLRYDGRAEQTVGVLDTRMCPDVPSAHQNKHTTQTTTQSLGKVRHAK